MGKYPQHEHLGIQRPHPYPFLVNRPLRHRFAALLAAVLFLLSGAGDAFGAHACPHHAAIAAPDYAVQAADHPDPHPSHGQPTPPVSHEEHDAHDGHEACTCAGLCPVGAGPAPLATPWVVRQPLDLPYAAPAAHPDPTGLPSRLAAHLLPFAQAPPQSA
jgi:hypothetical protein